MLVSIVIPIYNTGVNILKKCVSSVIEQSFQDFEIIIVNDCSTKKDTLSYLSVLSNTSQKIKVFHLEKNQGIAGSRNFGIEQATGKWICFLDHDDWWEKGYLQELLECGESKSTDMVVSGYKVVDESGIVLEYMAAKGNEDFVKSPWFIYGSSAPWNRLIRRDFLLENNIRFPEGCLTEDITFNITCNCLAHNPIGINGGGYCNRFNRDSASRSRKFIAMVYDEMPFDEIEKNCILGKSIEELSRRRIHEAAIGDQLTVLVCVFSRESDKYTKINARKMAARLVRTYMTGYIKSAWDYNKHMQNRPAMKVIYLGYMIAIRLHADRFYCAIVHTALRILMK